MAEFTYGQSCPVAIASEVFAQRWNPLILRQIMLGHHRYAEITRGLPRISSGVLAERLRFLERSGLVERRDGAYHLAEPGEALRPVVDALAAWGQTYVELRPHHVDPALLMQWLAERADPDAMPPDRVVIRFWFPTITKTYWLILQRPQCEVCLYNPGYPDDVTVTADATALANVFLARTSLGSAMRGEQLRLDGPSPLVRHFGDWFRFGSG